MNLVIATRRTHLASTLLFFGALIALTVYGFTHFSTTKAASVAQSGDALHQKVTTDLLNYVQWLEDNNAEGYVGEFGWPGNVSAEEQDRWNLLAASYYRNLNANNLWATVWATGSFWGDYKIALYQKIDPLAPGNIATITGQVPVFEANLSTQDYRRGVQVAGGSFGTPSGPTSSYSNVNPGVFGTDYFYDSQETFDYLASRGVDTVRIDFMWERIQPTLFGNLDAAELQRLKDVVERANSAGIDVILDLHNYGAYYIDDGTQGVRTTLGEPGLPTVLLGDVWQRLSNEFASDPGVIAYGLMNEPRDIAATMTENIMHYSFDSDIGGWTTNNGTLGLSASEAFEGADSMQLSNNFATNQIVFLDENQPGVIDYSANGSTLGVYVKIPAGTTGTYYGAISVMNPSFQFIQQTPATVLVPGQWTLVTFTPPAGLLDAARSFAITINANGAANQTTDVLIDSFKQGDSQSGGDVWRIASQEAVDAVRTNGDNKLLMVGGYGFSAIPEWTTNNPTGWITDSANNFRYEGHHYFDCNNTGAYNNDYDFDLACAEGEGFVATGAAAPTGTATVGEPAGNNTIPLALTASDDVDISSSLQMRLSSLSDFSDTSWVAFSSSALRSYTPDQEETVYIQFRDAAGNQSSVASVSFTVTANEAVSGQPAVIGNQPGVPNTGFLRTETLSTSLIALITLGTGLAIAYLGVRHLKRR